jgi:hypothetical protein
VALTFGGALKAYLEAQGLGISVTKDRTVKGQARPYCTYSGDLSLTIDGLEDGGAATGTEMLQLDLWQTLDQESPTLADDITKKLHGFRTSYGTPSKTVYGVLQRNRIRLIELVEVAKGQATSVVHHAYTLDIKRMI